MKFYKEFISFEYKGGEVLYIYPWLRNKFSKRFLSVPFMCYVSTLKEIDKIWNEYWRTEKILSYKSEYSDNKLIDGKPVYVLCTEVLPSGTGDTVTIEIPIYKKENE